MSHDYLTNLEKGRLPHLFISPSRCERNFRVILGAIAVISFIGGMLALCCGSGGSGAMADACMKGGYFFFATGIGSALLIGILEHYYSTRKYGNVRLDGSLMQPQNNINRFYNSLESLPWFQVLWHVFHQTFENLYNLKDGGWGGDYSTNKQLPQLYGPSKADPDSKNRLEVTHGGHATTLFRFMGQDGLINHILTDVNLDEGIPPQIGGRYLYTRGTDPGFTVDWLKTFVGTTFFNVFYSHDHGDHRSDATAQALVSDDGSQRPNFHCPKGLSSYFGALTPPIETATDYIWWDEIKLEGGVKAICVPAQHSTQTALTNCQLRLWCGWIFLFPTAREDDYFRVYFPGDIAGNINPKTKGFLPEYYAYNSTMFYQIKQYGPFDLMFYGLDPISGDQTNNHSNLAQGMDIIRWLNPTYVLPYHHGVWPFNDLPAENNGKLLIPLAKFESKFEKAFPNNEVGRPKMYPIKAGERVALLDENGDRCFAPAAADDGEKEI